MSQEAIQITKSGAKHREREGRGGEGKGRGREGEGKILGNGVNNRHRALRIAGEEYIYDNDKGNWASEVNIW